MRLGLVLAFAQACLSAGVGEIISRVLGLSPCFYFVRASFCAFFTKHSPDNNSCSAESVLTPS